MAPSFDELKNILNDPEWLADPDKKATQVALNASARYEKPETNPDSGKPQSRGQAAHRRYPVMKIGHLLDQFVEAGRHGFDKR